MRKLRELYWGNWIICKFFIPKVCSSSKSHNNIYIFCYGFVLDIQNALESGNVSLPDTADMLFERCNNSSWVVVFKALVTFHHLMSNANEVCGIYFVKVVSIVLPISQSDSSQLYFRLIDFELCFHFFFLHQQYPLKNKKTSHQTCVYSIYLGID